MTPTVLRREMLRVLKRPPLEKEKTSIEMKK
jgi:hypothetical protein